MKTLKQRLLEGASFDSLTKEFHKSKTYISDYAKTLTDEEKSIRMIAKAGKPKIPIPNTNTNTTINSIEIQVLIQKIVQYMDMMKYWEVIKEWMRTKGSGTPKYVEHYIKEMDSYLELYNPE